MEAQADLKILIVVAGPTASGKTAAAISLAKHYNTVVVSADSRQFYREMSIGTAKPTQQELNQVKHYFIDNLSIAENYTAGDYETECLSLLKDLFKTHHVVVLAGGSGLFIKAVCEGFDQFPDIDPQVRTLLNQQLTEHGLSYLQEKLKSIDPTYYNIVDLNNPQRVIRALEIFEATGKPYSLFRQKNVKERPFKVVKFGLTMPRASLYRRINERVDEMVKRGLVNEARSLLHYRDLNALNTVGYSEIFDYLDGKTDLKTALDLIKQNTRRFAKRQLTWFGKDKDLVCLNAEDDNLVSQMILLTDEQL